MIIRINNNSETDMPRLIKNNYKYLYIFQFKTLMKQSCR